jgi:hypothetical protein
MDRTNRTILLVAWLSLVAIVALNTWQTRQAAQAANYNFCHAIDNRVKIEAGILSILVAQGAATQEEANAELDYEAQVLASLCPDYRSPTPQQPEGEP